MEFIIHQREVQTVKEAIIVYFENSYDPVHFLQG